MKKFSKCLGSAIAGTFLMAGVASAGTLTGGISFNGFDWSPTMDNGNVVGVDFTPNTGIAGSGTFDFAHLNGLPAEIYDFAFASLPAQPLWSVGTYLLEVDDVVVMQNRVDLVSLEGVGTIYSPTFDPTPANWSLTAQSESGDFGSTTFSWSASTATGSSPIPEPGTMLLLGTGLIGLAGMARRRTAA